MLARRGENVYADPTLLDVAGGGRAVLVPSVGACYDGLDGAPGAGATPRESLCPSGIRTREGT